MNAPALEYRVARPQLMRTPACTDARALDPRPWLRPHRISAVQHRAVAAPLAGSARASTPPPGTGASHSTRLRLVLAALALLICLPAWLFNDSARATHPVPLEVAFDASLPMLASALKLEPRNFLQRHAVLGADRLVARGEAQIALSQPRLGTVLITAMPKVAPQVLALESSIRSQRPDLQVQIAWAHAGSGAAGSLPFTILTGLVALCLLPGVRMAQAHDRRELLVRLSTRGLGGLGLSLSLLLLALTQKAAMVGLATWALTAAACLLLSFALAAVGQGLDRAVAHGALRWALWALAVLTMLSAGAASTLGWEPSGLLLAPTLAATDLLRGILDGAGFRYPPELTVALLACLLVASPLLHPSAGERALRPRRQA